MKWLMSNKEGAGITAGFLAHRAFERWAEEIKETVGTVMRPADTILLTRIITDVARSYLGILYRSARNEDEDKMPDGAEAVRDMTFEDLADLMRVYQRAEGGLDDEANIEGHLFTIEQVGHFLAWAFGKPEVGG